MTSPTAGIFSPASPPHYGRAACAAAPSWRTACSSPLSAGSPTNSLRLRSRTTAFHSPSRFCTADPAIATCCLSWNCAADRSARTIAPASIPSRSGGRSSKLRTAGRSRSPGTEGCCGGIAYAQSVPFVEARDQGARGRNTSKLLQYLDPTVDFSVGDLFGSRDLRETYFGLGVSHRSGMFGMAQIFDNVNGGSNYIYTYVEWRM